MGTTDGNHDKRQAAPQECAMHGAQGGEPGNEALGACDVWLVPCSEAGGVSPLDHAAEYEQRRVGLLERGVDLREWRPVRLATLLEALEQLGRESLSPEASWGEDAATSFTLATMNGSCHGVYDPRCQDEPTCASCKANVEANPWMLSEARTRG